MEPDYHVNGGERFFKGLQKNTLNLKWFISKDNLLDFWSTEEYTIV